MKWVKYRDGSWKYVEDSNSLPEDKEFTAIKRKGSPMVITSVPWSDSEKLIYSGSDAKTQHRATEEFTSERDKWTKSSGRLRRWEEDRKKEAYKNKPAWRKKKMQEDPLLAMNTYKK